MRRSIKITKRRLNEIVSNSIKEIISESTKISEFTHKGQNLSVIFFDANDKDDMDFILANKETIWDILQKGYESKGGFKGFESIRDMLKKSPFYKIGFLDNEIITVTVYNRYLGGEKCVGATCVKDNRHESAVKLLKLIIEHNVTNWNKWIWIEASGKVEAFCREANAFNVPTEFVSLYLEAIPFEPIENDKYHYKRKIKGNIETKTIFGFRDRLSFELLKEKLNKEVSDFLKKVENKMNESEESLLDLYLQKKHPAFRHKAIVDYFVYLKDDEQCDEFTPQMLNTLQKSIDAMEDFLKNGNMDKDDTEIIEIAIDEGNRVLNTVNPLIPIKIQE